jgi:hypothetical protein
VRPPVGSTGPGRWWWNVGAEDREVGDGMVGDDMVDVDGVGLGPCGAKQRKKDRSGGIGTSRR